MARVITIAIALGLLLGIVGGLTEGSSWMYRAGLILTVSVVALYAVAIWKNPSRVAKAEAEVEAVAAGYPEEHHRADAERPNGEQMHGADLVPSNLTLARTDRQRHV